jgi:hypothetical protein
VLHLFFPNLPLNWAVLTGNGNMTKQYEGELKKKECPAPRSVAYTLVLTPLSTHLSFRWTLPLKMLL